MLHVFFVTNIWTKPEAVAYKIHSSHHFAKPYIITSLIRRKSNKKSNLMTRRVIPLCFMLVYLLHRGESLENNMGNLRGAASNIANIPDTDTQRQINQGSRENNTVIPIPTSGTVPRVNYTGRRRKLTFWGSFLRKCCIRFFVVWRYFLVYLHSTHLKHAPKWYCRRVNTST